MKKYSETNINDEILKSMIEVNHYGWDSTFSEDAVKMLLEGMAKYLGNIAEENKTHAAVIEDLQGNFHLAAYVEPVKGAEDGNDSYTLKFTFDPEDIKDDFVKVTLKDPMFRSILADIGLTKYGLSFKSIDGTEFVTPTMCTIADCIKSYLNANVAVDPVVEMEKYFKASAELDGDKVYYRLTPYEILKQHIKNDAQKEKKAA